MMRSATIEKNQVVNNDIGQIRQASLHAWEKIAPLWPLRNIIARNPLTGVEKLSFETAVAWGAKHLQQADIPAALQHINRETIKWCQAFFDDGQATFPMPCRALGLFHSWKLLAQHDKRIHNNDPEKLLWLQTLANCPEFAINRCLTKLDIKSENYHELFTLLLTSLPGWAGYIQYLVNWPDSLNPFPFPISHMDFLAMRLVLVVLLWPDIISQLKLNNGTDNVSYQWQIAQTLKKIQHAEQQFRDELLPRLQQQAVNTHHNDASAPEAQVVFCIDVRSEPFRRAFEAQGNYQTLGFAGFFGIPVGFENTVTGEIAASCPVLLQPKHIINEVLEDTQQSSQTNWAKVLKQFYHGLKYNFSTRLALVEVLGPWLGLSMLMRTFSAMTATKCWRKLIGLLVPNYTFRQDLSCNEMNKSSHGIPLSAQCAYAEGALKMMGLVKDFAPVVIFCGHGSACKNNPQATSLDCGACGGRHGGSNAELLANILNQAAVRKYLQTRAINIPDHVLFIAAEHNTTTDEVVLIVKQDIAEHHHSAITALQSAFIRARDANCAWRSQQLENNPLPALAITQQIATRSADWAQTRPEWGLAKNAAFIIGPRSLTQSVDLLGRSFLHSYDWTLDNDGALLTVILTAPMVVAQWINSQYLFSTLDNVAYGAGSKITQNITGKIAIMQGNASDLMHGLSLQSVNRNDVQAYHEPMRLLTVVYAPRDRVSTIVEQQPILQRLFGNRWVHLAVLDPDDQRCYLLQTDFSWSVYQ